jgi:hypothetical protein
MKSVNSVLAGVLAFAMASALLFAPGCGLDDLPVPDDAPLPPADNGSNDESDEQDQNQGQDEAPSEVSGEDPGTLPVYPGAVRIEYGTDGAEHFSTYVAPAEPDEIVEFYEAEIDKLGWSIAQRKSDDREFIMIAANEQGQVVGVMVSYVSTKWSGYSEFSLGWGGN